MMGKLETGNIGIGNTSTLATINNDRFLIINDKELYVIGASLKDLGRKCFAFTKLDASEIRRIKKSASLSWTFAPPVRPPLLPKTSRQPHGRVLKVMS